MRIQSHRDLRVWQAAMDMVTEIYRVTEAFPRDERFGLTQQIRRAVVSVPSNIAEGHGRGYTHGKRGDRPNEYLRFLSIARGSLVEVQTQIEIAGRLEYLSEEQVSATLDQTASVLRQLYALRNALEKREGRGGRSDELGNMEDEAIELEEGDDL